MKVLFLVLFSVSTLASFGQTLPHNRGRVVKRDLDVTTIPSSEETSSNNDDGDDDDDDITTSEENSISASLDTKSAADYVTQTSTEAAADNDEADDAEEADDVTADSEDSDQSDEKTDPPTSHPSQETDEEVEKVRRHIVTSMRNRNSRLRSFSIKRDVESQRLQNSTGGPYHANEKADPVELLNPPSVSAAAKRKALKRTIKAIKKPGKRRGSSKRTKLFREQKSHLENGREIEGDVSFRNGGGQRRTRNKNGKVLRRLKPVKFASAKDDKHANELTVPDFKGFSRGNNENLIHDNRLTRKHLQRIPNRKLKRKNKSYRRMGISDRSDAKTGAGRNATNSDFPNAATNNEAVIDDAFNDKQNNNSIRRAGTSGILEDEKADLLEEVAGLETGQKHKTQELRKILQKHDPLVEEGISTPISAKEKMLLLRNNNIDNSRVSDDIAVRTNARQYAYSTSKNKEPSRSKEKARVISGSTSATVKDLNENRVTSNSKTVASISFGEQKDTSYVNNITVSPEATKVYKSGSASSKVSEVIFNKLRKFSQVEKLMPRSKFQKQEGLWKSQRGNKRQADKFKILAFMNPKQAGDNSASRMRKRNEENSTEPHSHYYQVLEYVNIPDNDLEALGNSSEFPESGRNQYVEKQVEEVSNVEKRILKDSDRIRYSSNVQREVTDLTLMASSTEAAQQNNTSYVDEEDSQFKETASPTYYLNTEITEELKGASSLSLESNRSSSYSTPYSHSPKIFSSTVFSSEILYPTVSTKKPEELFDTDIIVEKPMEDISPEDIDRPALYDKKDGIGFPNEDTLVNGNDSLYNRDHAQQSENKEFKISVRIKSRDGNETYSTISNYFPRAVVDTAPTMKLDASNSEGDVDKQR